MRLSPVLAVLLASAASPLAADPDRLSFLLGSHHIDAAGNFQEFNPGVFLTWERRLDYSLGIYRNSYDRLSVAGTLAWPVYETGDFQLDLFGALALYPKDGRRFEISFGDVILLGGLQMRYRNAFLQVIPSDGGEVDAIVSFGLTFDLN